MTLDAPKVRLGLRLVQHLPKMSDRIVGILGGRKLGT